MSDMPDAAGRKKASAGLTICVQGLGFVGAANAIAIAGAHRADGTPLHRVIGVDLPTSEGQKRAAAISDGRFPYATTDVNLLRLADTVRAAGNLSAVTDPAIFAEADVIVVDVGLDLESKGDNPSLALPNFERAIDAVGHWMRPDALVLLESTVPPGTSERIVAPRLKQRLAERGFLDAEIRLAYCYERVMPGDAYLASIIDMWRVYAGSTPAVADATEAFLSTFIGVEKKPLRRLANLRSAELAKVLENTYRAVNIALIDEWEKFARRIDVDLFEVVEAIRVRPTHNNIRQPGLGVGGYCLSKDPLFGLAAATEIWGIHDIAFPLSVEGTRINDDMPHNTVDVLREKLGSLADKRILILGASYRQDVGDTRHSPSITLASRLLAERAQVTLADPLVENLDEHDLAAPLVRSTPSAAQFDAVVLAVAHAEYRSLNLADWLVDSNILLCDANGVLSAAELNSIRVEGRNVVAIGRGA